jgi:hypothetical protein
MRGADARRCGTQTAKVKRSSLLEAKWHDSALQVDHRCSPCRPNTRQRQWDTTRKASAALTPGCMTCVRLAAAEAKRKGENPATVLRYTWATQARPKLLIGGTSFDKLNRR